MSNVWTPIDSTWKLTFDDEFNGNQINTSRWGIPNNTPDTSYTGRSATYEASNITVSSGMASMRTQLVGSTYTTCSMTSNFRQSRGYWEARIKLPTLASGMACSFWMDALNWVMPEIDILEWFGSSPNRNMMTWHYSVPNDGTSAWGVSQTRDGLPLPGIFHVYGMLWDYNQISWYIDGLLAAQTTAFVDSNNAPSMQTILLATLPTGAPNNSLGTMLVDYVHIFSNDPTAVAVTPDTGYGGPGDAIGSGN